MIKTFLQFVNESENGMLADKDLVNIASTGETGGQHKLNAEAAKAYDEMKKAAEADGIDWQITDSYRDYDSQVEVAAKKGLYKNGGLAAEPGTSNHGWGSAVDLKLDDAAQKWLQANAAKYGFSNIPREPWHWEHKASANSAKGLSGKSEAGTVLIDADLIQRLIEALKAKNFSQDDLNKFTHGQNVKLVSAEDEDFYKAILKALGANETPEKLKFLHAWRQGEGGQAKNNPFNTTKDIPGDSDTKYNSVGVRNYPDRQSGLDATIATLKLPYYKELVDMLKRDTVTADELARSQALKTWGTGDMVVNVLSKGKVNPPAIA